MGRAHFQVVRAFSCLLFVLLLLGATGADGAAEFEVPTLTGPIVDNGGFLSAGTERQISSALLEIKRLGGGTEIAVLTVEDLGGLTIEQASIEVVDKWKLGSEDQDNGVLLLCSKADRRVRIEVGQGLEGQLTDAHSKRIIDETIVPLFRSGNMEQGVLLGVYQIAMRTNPDLDFKQIFGEQSRNLRGSPGEGRGFGWVIPLLFLLFMIFGGRGRGRGQMAGGFLTGMLLGSMGGRRYGGGGFGGGGFGGGGFGGGGGFSGGGASGGW